MKIVICSLALLFSMMSYAEVDDSLPIGFQNIEFTHFVADVDADDPEIFKPQPQLEPLFKLENPDQHELEVENDQRADWTTPEDIQRNLAEEHERNTLDYSILTNKFYENDRLRIFNYTAYNVQQFRNSLMNPAVSNSDINALYISFGYGIEFKLNHSNTIGYEYLSSFPYDRGQILRFYWNRTLKY